MVFSDDGSKVYVQTRNFVADKRIKQGGNAAGNAIEKAMKRKESHIVNIK